MACCTGLVAGLCCAMTLTALGVGYKQSIRRVPYSRSALGFGSRNLVPAKVAWLLQELPSFLVPVLLWGHSEEGSRVARALLLGLFCGHYFHRTFIYSLLTNGRPSPLRKVIYATIFCSLNGFLQGYYMLHCTNYDEAWLSDIRLVTGLILFFLGMAINIHSDYILRNLRKPGEVNYNIPKGGMFEYVSGANFFGEILEWFGYAIATWSLPALSFAVFTMCYIGPRAYHRHRFYQEKFPCYPRSRKAVIPFVF